MTSPRRSNLATTIVPFLAFLQVSVFLAISISLVPGTPRSSYWEQYSTDRKAPLAVGRPYVPCRVTTVSPTLRERWCCRPSDGGGQGGEQLHRSPCVPGSASTSSPAPRIPC